MKKTILTEINRTREIMGLTPLILEQSSLLRFFRGLLKAGDSPMVALGKTIRREFGDAVGIIPITKLVKNSNMVEVLSEVMEKTNAVIRNNGQALSKRFKGVGIEISESQASSLGKAWSKGEDEFLIAINRIARETMEDVSTILIKGTPSEFQKPLIDAISGVVKVKNLDEFRMVLKQIELPDDQITKIMNNISTSGTIGGKGRLEDIFGALINHPNYQDDMIKILRNSDEFQRLVRQDFGIGDLATMMGRKADDPLVKSIYQKAIKKTVREKITTTAKKPFQWLFLTKQGKYFIGYVLFTLGINYIMDYFFGYSMGKVKAGLTPDLYQSVFGYEKFLKDKGGYTDDEALGVAEELNEALYGNIIPGTVDDDAIIEIYKKIPSILAASQVCWMWENKVPGTTGTLEQTLLDRMQIKLAPTPATRLAGDVTKADVEEELEKKTWTDSKGVTTRREFMDVVNKNWPRYTPVLYDRTSQPYVKYYSKKNGPIENPLLASLAENCGGKNWNDCMRKYDPLLFNSISKSIYSEAGDIYLEEPPETTIDTTGDFAESFLDPDLSTEDRQKVFKDLMDKVF